MTFAPDPRDFQFNEQGQREYYRQALLAAHSHEALIHSMHDRQVAQTLPDVDCAASTTHFLLLLS
jgi:hypothetical protein